MFRRLIMVLVLWMGLLQSGMALERSPEQLAQDVVSHSGIVNAIQQIPGALKGALRQDLKRSGATDAEIENLTGKIDRSFDADELTRMLEEHVLALMSRQDMEQVLGWLDSPLGRKIVAAEIDAGTAQGNLQMSQQVGALIEQYQGTDRQKLFQVYDQATHATEALVEGTLSMQLARIAATLAAEETAQSFAAFNEIRRDLHSRRATLYDMLTREAYASYLYIYRDLSLEEISHYIDFARSDAGSRYVQVLIDGVWEVVTARTEHFERYVANVRRPDA